MNKLFGNFAIYVLVFLSTGAISGIYTGEEALKSGTATASSNATLQLAYGSLYLLLILLMLPQFRALLPLLFREKWMSLLILLAVASTLWSIEPSDTFRRSLGLLGTTLAGLYIGTHVEPKRQVRIVAFCVGVAAVLSLIAGLTVPHVAISPDGWQGVFFQKNTLGRIMSLGIVAMAFIAVGQRRYRIAAIATIPLCALLLLLSGSVTAAAITIALLVGILLVPVLRWPASRLIAFGVAVTALAIPTVLWVFQNADSVLRALGKETHLTGRLPLWALVRAEIATMPILGHGYAAFWSTAESDRFRQALNWDVMNAHNGFLEMMLGLGVVGLIIFVIGLIRNIYLGFVVARAGDTLDQAWPLFFLAFALLWDVTDSALFAGNSIMWLLYTTNAFWLVSTAAELRAEKRARYAPANQEPEFAST